MPPKNSMQSDNRAIENEVRRYASFSKEIGEDKDRILSDSRKLISFNIGHLRKFSDTLLTVNISVIGAILAALLTNIAGDGNCSLFFGMIVLILNAILLVLYSALVIVGENDTLMSRHRFLERTFSQTQQLLMTSAEAGDPFNSFEEKHMKDVEFFSKEESELTTAAEKRSFSAKYLYVFSGFFILGLVFSIFGLVSSL